MKVAVILNGEPFVRKITEDVIICADGGYNLLPKDKIASYLVGDMDSINGATTNVKTTVFPTQKNYTDGELAIVKAKELGATFIAIYGATGGRPDHIYANISLLNLANTLGIEATICADNCDIYYKNTSFNIKTEPKDIISLIPFGSNCLIKSSTNLEYELSNLLLTKEHSGRGVSNIACNKFINIEIASGALLVFHIFS